MTIDIGRFRHCVVAYPVHHKRKVPFNPPLNVPIEFGRRARQIHDLDRELSRFVLPRSALLRLASEAYSSNIHHSSKIEGNPLSIEEVHRVASDPFRGRSPVAHDASEQDVVNQLIALLDPKVFTMPWTISTLQDVHAIVMGGLGEVAVPGMFRSEPGVVRTDEGQETFIPCPPEHIVPELESLLSWLNSAGEALHPVMAATLFFHEFESIHPFENGNGRTGRVLFHGYLQTHGLTNVNACKVEAEILRDAEFYYRILGWTDLSGSYSELLDFVTESLLTAYSEAAKRFEEKDLLAAGTSETTRRLLEMARAERDWFSVRTASRWVPNVSEQTIRHHLSLLSREGALETRGRTRAKVYRFSASLREALEFVRQYARRTETPRGTSS